MNISLRRSTLKGQFPGLILGSAFSKIEKRYALLYKMTIVATDFDKNIKNKHILVVGKRATGKTAIVRHICENQFKGRKGLIFGHGYNSFAGREGIEVRNTLDLSLIRKLIDEKKEQRINCRSNHGYTCSQCLSFSFVILDCELDFKSHAVKELIFNGRHFMISVIIVVQSLKGLSPAFRDNFDYYFICDNNPRYSERLWRIADLSFAYESWRNERGDEVLFPKEPYQARVVKHTYPIDQYYMYNPITLLKQKHYTIKIQRMWRNRHFYRHRRLWNRVCREVELLPNRGILYFKAKKRFESRLVRLPH